MRAGLIQLFFTRQEPSREEMNGKSKKEKGKSKKPESGGTGGLCLPIDKRWGGIYHRMQTKFAYVNILEARCLNPPNAS